MPLNTPKATTVLSAKRLDGQFVCRTFEGGTAKDRFPAYLREELLPCLKKGGTVVMDNLRAHHTKGAEEMLRSADAVPLYLPPCSPDFNPIEKMRFKMKEILRKMRVRSQDLLDNAVRQALSCISASHCEGLVSMRWFLTVFAQIALVYKESLVEIDDDPNRLWWIIAAPSKMRTLSTIPLLPSMVRLRTGKSKQPKIAGTYSFHPLKSLMSVTRFYSFFLLKNPILTDRPISSPSDL